MAIQIGNNTPGVPFEAQNGLTYVKTFENVYVSVASPIDPPEKDTYVLRAGDNMTGSLKSPRFVGNYALEDLREVEDTP